MKQGRINSREVARMAGVSIATVSLVVNGSPQVKDSTRQRVQEVIDRLGYQSHAAAAALRSARASTLGYIVPEVIDAANDVFRHQVLSGIVTRAQKSHYHVLMDTFLGPRQHTVLFNSGRIDGAVVDWESDDDTINGFIKRNMPFVLVGRESDNPAVNTVRADERSGCYEAMRHLITLGHRRIAIIAGRGNRGTVIADERLAGMQRALAEAGLSLAPGDLVYGNWRYASGYALGTELLSRTPRPTAIFPMSELIAVGVFKAAQHLGLRVPTDVSIITTEDTPWVEYMSPELSAVHIPMYDVGVRATELLLGILEQREGNEDDTDEHTRKEPQHIVLPTTLVVRETTCPPTTFSSH